MTATRLTGGPKIRIACFTQITVSNTFGIPLHLQQDIFKFHHDTNSIIIDIVVKRLLGGKNASDFSLRKTGTFVHNVHSDSRSNYSQAMHVVHECPGYRVSQ